MTADAASRGSAQRGASSVVTSSSLVFTEGVVSSTSRICAEEKSFFGALSWHAASFASLSSASFIAERSAAKSAAEMGRSAAVTGGGVRLRAAVDRLLLLVLSLPPLFFLSSSRVRPRPLVCAEGDEDEVPAEWS